MTIPTKQEQALIEAELHKNEFKPFADGPYFPFSEAANADPSLRLTEMMLKTAQLCESAVETDNQSPAEAGEVG